MATCVQEFNRCSIAVNIILATVAVASVVVTAVALAVIFSMMATPFLLFPGAYSIIAIVSGSISLLSITALVIKAICGTNQSKISTDVEDLEEFADVEDAEELEDFIIPSKQPKNVSDNDWAILCNLDLADEKREAISAEEDTGMAQKYIKISRKAYEGLTYSYILHKSGKIYRCTHKTSRHGESTEREFAKGGFKKAYHCYDENNKPTLVRAVVMNEAKFLNSLRRFQEAYKQYPNDPDLVVGVPHTYRSILTRHGSKIIYHDKKQVFYTPKMNCLDRLNPSRLTEKQLIDIFQQILRLIERVHKDGGAHKDIKVENILWRRDAQGKIKVALMDFDMYTRKDQNGASGTRSLMPHTFIDRRDLTLKDCQEGDVYATAFIAIELFGSRRLCNEIINARKDNEPLDIDDVRKRFQEEAKSKPFFGQIAPLILKILERKDDGYRNASDLLSLFNEKVDAYDFIE